MDKLMNGSTNRDEVVRLKADLQLLNYYKGPLSDEFGSELEAAVKSFQADHSLTPDGIVTIPSGPTRDSIDKAIDIVYEITPGKLEQEANGEQDRASAEETATPPVYWATHKYHPRFDQHLSAPYTHIHPFDVLRSVAGEKEISGSKDNPLIAHFHEHSGNLGTHRDVAKYHDEVAHCASAMNWANDGGGCKKTNNALAASHDKYPGKALKKGDMIPVGALVRIAHPGGHITFANRPFVWREGETFEGFGSNQSNSIKTSYYSTNHIVSVHICEPLPGTVLAPIGYLGNKPVPVTGSQGESTR